MVNPRLQYLETLPKKRMAVGVLIFDTQDRLLIVKPHYRPYWTLPGGVVDRNESPLEAARREVQEELGLEVRIIRCAAIDYVRTQIGGQWTEGLYILFWGEALPPDRILEIRLQREELEAFRLIPWTGSFPDLEPNLARRIQQVLDHRNCCLYMENGTPLL